MTQELKPEELEKYPNRGSMWNFHQELQKLDEERKRRILKCVIDIVNDERQKAKEQNERTQT